ncbi:MULTISPECIES: universal stress protein [unclassified Streptomyces]|uniref:universal stress protein n=1 Tax=unclassified Streptomyces TaxID=2593676 RepID=UPI002E78141D|nr:universal stress protein [Streptomyces sp. JV184]MEE1742911.1 universal stress protein [Streptomyces sp. JV184]
MNRRIVVGLDGSAESIAAAHWAAREALLRSAPLHLVHAEIWSPPQGVPATGSEERRQAARILLREASDELLDKHPRLEISAESYDGQPAASLARAATGAGMVVLGSRGLGTLKGFVLGSVGMAVVHSVERPVVLVRSTEDALPHAQGRHLDRGMVVGVDTGRPCDALLSFAFDEASRRGCTLHALHSWMLPPLAGSGAAYNPEVNAQIARTERTGLDDMLRPWQAMYPAVELDAQVSVGPASEQLLEAGSQAGLMVVGRRIRRSSVGTHIGPVAHAILHHSTAPVAVIAHE